MISSVVNFGGKRPWHDWAMVNYELDDGGDVDVAAKVLLWAAFVDSNARKDKEQPVRLYTAIHSLNEYEPNDDDILFFCKTDVLAPDIDVVPFESVATTAYVLPINRKRTDAFPKCFDDASAFCVFPPRSEWNNIGWDHDFLKPENLNNIESLVFL
jgi:hypothetical protein